MREWLKSLERSQKYGYRIPEDGPRQRPFIGDIVKFTTHRLQKNSATWASVTFKQSFEIVKENPKAREELQNFVEQKKHDKTTNQELITADHLIKIMLL